MIPFILTISGGAIFDSTGGGGRGSAVNLTTDEKPNEPQKAEVIRRACAGGLAGDVGVAHLSCHHP